MLYLFSYYCYCYCYCYYDYYDYDYDYFDDYYYLNSNSNSNSNYDFLHILIIHFGLCSVVRILLLLISLMLFCLSNLVGSTRMFSYGLVVFLVIISVMLCLCITGIAFSIITISPIWCPTSSYSSDAAPLTPSSSTKFPSPTPSYSNSSIYSHTADIYKYKVNLEYNQ